MQGKINTNNLPVRKKTKANICLRGIVSSFWCHYVLVYTFISLWFLVCFYVFNLFLNKDFFNLLLFFNDLISASLLSQPVVLLKEFLISLFQSKGHLFRGGFQNFLLLCFFDFFELLFCLIPWVCFYAIAMNLMQECFATGSENCHKVAILADVWPFSYFSLNCKELIEALLFVEFIQNYAKRFLKVHSVACDESQMKEFFIRFLSKQFDKLNTCCQSILEFHILSVDVFVSLQTIVRAIFETTDEVQRKINDPLIFFDMREVRIRLYHYPVSYLILDEREVRIRSSYIYISTKLKNLSIVLLNKLRRKLPWDVLGTLSL